MNCKYCGKESENSICNNCYMLAQNPNAGFCNNCKEWYIDHCPYCGQSFKKENTIVNEQYIQPQTEQKKGYGGIIGAIIAIIFIVICVTVAYEATNKNNLDNKITNGISTGGDGNGGSGSSGLKLLTRSANNGDISITWNYDFTLSVDCKVKPSSDINNLQLTFTFLDKNKKTLTTKTKMVGNVLKNTEYSVSLTLSEVGLTTLWNLDNVVTNVSGGTISYLG